MSRTTRKELPAHGTHTHFVHRDVMRRTHPMAKAVLPNKEHTAPPATVLPVDCTGNATAPCPMDGNDEYGDCGPVMCAHVDTIRSFGQGKAGFTPVMADQTKLVAQYLQVSGGDNGTDEDMLVGASGIWMSGIAGDASAVVVDHLDVDITDLDLRDYCVDQFYAVCMAWSVPDDVLKNFTTGVKFLNADTPDPNNGHFTPFADIDADRNVRVWTWGSWFLASPTFLASVDPECFATFSALQFNAAGYDSHGRHVSDQAAKWVALGGNPVLVAKVVAMFPAAGAPPAPVDPTPEPAPFVDAGPVVVPGT